MGVIASMYSKLACDERTQEGSACLVIAHSQRSKWIGSRPQVCSSLVADAMTFILATKIPTFGSTLLCIQRESKHLMVADPRPRITVVRGSRDTVTHSGATFTSYTLTTCTPLHGSSGY